MTGDAIQLKNVSLEFRSRSTTTTRGRPVLQDISLNVRRGETLGIIGRNGAGKSTLLKIMAGVVSPDCGSVDINVRRCILLSYQLGFNNKLTGRDNVIYSGLLHGLSLAQINERMDTVIEFSGIGAAIDEQLSTYSSGMKARLGFAVSIQSDPDVILIDEALGVGDREFRERSSAYIRSWIRSNKTVVFVSHDESSVRNLCDRAAWLESGRVVACGSVNEVLNQYYDFDHLVKRISEILKIPQEVVRADEKNNDPIRVLNTLRDDLRADWQEEDRIAHRSNVRIFRPGRSIPTSQLAQEECGSWVWVETARELCRGDKTEVTKAFDKYEDFVGKLARQLKLDRQDLRQTELHSACIDLLATINET